MIPALAGLKDEILKVLASRHSRRVLLVLLFFVVCLFVFPKRAMCNLTKGVRRRFYIKHGSHEGQWEEHEWTWESMKPGSTSQLSHYELCDTGQIT